MTNAEIIAAVNRWQANGLIHPLTCGNNSQWHTLLRPVEVDGQVVLACPDCDYRQTMIPDVVLTFTGGEPASVDWLRQAAERRQRQSMNPKLADRRPCSTLGCFKTQTFVEHVGSEGPGWICPSGHVESAKQLD